MDVIKVVMTDAQMLYTKKDVVVLLEQMQEQYKALDVHTDNSEVIANLQAKYALDLAIELNKQRYELIEKACAWLEKNLYPTIKTNYDNNVGVESRQEFIEKFKQAMKE